MNRQTQISRKLLTGRLSIEEMAEVSSGLAFADLSTRCVDMIRAACATQFLQQSVSQPCRFVIRHVSSERCHGEYFVDYHLAVESVQSGNRAELDSDAGVAFENAAEDECTAQVFAQVFEAIGVECDDDGGLRPASPSTLRGLEQVHEAALFLLRHQNRDEVVVEPAAARSDLASA